MTLTPAQFNIWKRKNNRPLATFAGYKQWVANKNAQRQAAAVAAGPTYLTPAQMTAQANAQVAAQIRAQQAANAASTAAAQRQANQQAARAQGYAVAVANILQPTAKQTAQEYTDTANRIAGYGAGLTSAAGEAYQQSQQEAARHLAEAGAGTPVPQANQAAALDTMRYLGATMPAATLAEQAPLAENLARAENLTRAWRSEDIAQQYKAKTTDLQAELALKQQALQATRPDLFQKAISDIRAQQEKSLSDYRGQALQQRAIDIQQGQLELAQAKNAQDQAIALTKISNTLWLVGKDGQPYNTGQPAPGTPAAIAAAVTQGKIKVANINRQAKIEAANIAKAASKYGADTSAKARTDAATIAANARKAAAQIASGKKGGATPKQKADIIKGVAAVGSSAVEKARAAIWATIPGTQKQGKNESDDDYNKRVATATAAFQQKLTAQRREIVNQVNAVIAPLLQVLGYDANRIFAYAGALVDQYIPVNTWVGLHPGK